MDTNKAFLKRVKDILKKFHIKKSAIAMLIISTIISGISYIVCVYYLNFTERIVGMSEMEVVVLKTTKDILLTCVSIFGGTLLVNVLVEAKSKNQFLTEIINNDVIASPIFYEQMNDSLKKKMYKALEETLYYSEPIQKQIYECAREKLSKIPEDYYFEECSYAVTCKVFSNYIEKHITRTITVAPYKRRHTIKEFQVSVFHAKSVQGMQSYELVEFKINGENFKDKVLPLPGVREPLDDQNGYDFSTRYVYKGLELKATAPVEIIIKYISRTSIDDRSSTFRTTKPCHKFSLLYTLDESPNYRIGVDAFGFMDDANKSINTDSHHDLNIVFNDWIFDCDGVVVTLLDKV